MYTALWERVQPQMLSLRHFWQICICFTVVNKKETCSDMRYDEMCSFWAQDPQSLHETRCSRACVDAAAETHLTFAATEEIASFLKFFFLDTAVPMLQWQDRCVKTAHSTRHICNEGKKSTTQTNHPQSGDTIGFPLLPELNCCSASVSNAPFVPHVPHPSVFTTRSKFLISGEGSLS